MVRRLSAILLGALLAGCPSETKEQGGCERCHGGIEDPHPPLALTCIDCHGGNPDGETRETAHVGGPASIEQIRTMTTTQLDAVPAEYLRFLNPSDLRVAEIGCGSQSPAVDGAGCHQMKVEAVSRSMHSTLAGITTVPRFNGSVQQGRLAERGAVSLVDPDFDAATAPPFTVPSIEQVEVTDVSESGPGDLPDFVEHTMAKRCIKCHLNVYGGGTTEFGNYRSSGCAGCHMVYENDGLARGGDPMIDQSSPAHPREHVLTTAIPDAQCEHCHWRGNRVGTAYKGWRERASGGRDVKENTLRNDAPLHTRGIDFFVLDEDTTNDVDETPPDIHYQMGMGCIDCHLGPDNHGDGFIHTTMDVEGKIECEDCHGTFETRIEERNDGFVNDGGFLLRHMTRAADGAVMLTSLVDGSTHPVTQIVDLAANDNLTAAHDTDNHGSLECYACHTAWSQNCYGCHTSVDFRKPEKNPITGALTRGKTSGNRDVVTLENLHLAINTDGKIGIFMVQNMFFSVVVSCNPAVETCDVDPTGPTPGRTVINSQVRTSPEGKLGFSWGPGVPHTTANADTVQPCDRCHPKADGSNMERVRLTYGFGNGQYTFTDGVTGIEHDLTKMIDANGESVVAFAHVGTGPVPFEIIQRALAYELP